MAAKFGSGVVLRRLYNLSDAGQCHVLRCSVTALRLERERFKVWLTSQGKLWVSSYDAFDDYVAARRKAAAEGLPWINLERQASGGPGWVPLMGTTGRRTTDGSEPSAACETGTESAGGVT